MEDIATAVKREFRTPPPDAVVPWPEQADARIAALEARVQTLEQGAAYPLLSVASTTGEIFNATLEKRVRLLETIAHRLLNPADDEPDCDRCGGY